MTSAADNRPKVGSVWVWEVNKPHARALIEVEEVFWNGEEWWIRTKTLLPNATEGQSEINDLDRFWEAVSAVQFKR